MFDTYYRFNKVGKDNAHERPHLKRVIYYNFRTEKSLYIVEVEEYFHDIFILKYYQKKYRNHPKKFQILSHEHKCRKIVGTCVRIMLSIHSSNKNACFGFIGANTYDIETKREEPTDNTQRFRIYKHAMEGLIGPESFTHSMIEEDSSYIMISIARDVDFILKKAAEIFTTLNTQNN